MAQPNKVVWSEGLFLRPQHFQQTDRWTEALVHGATAGLINFGWGFRSLELDTMLTDQGKLAFGTGAGIFPDGTPFAVPGDTPAPDPIAFAHKSKTGIVYLALPHVPEGGAAIDPAHMAPTGARYRAHEMEVGDELEGAESNRVPMGVARPALRLMMEHEHLDGYTTLAIARVSEVNADGGLVLDKDFIPPCLRIDVSPVIKGFLGELSVKIDGLAQEQTGWVAGRRAQGVAEVRDLLLLQLVNRNKPVIDHLEQMGSAHPERIYALLLALSGDLATFTRAERRPISYERYAHEDLRLCYLPLMAELRRQLGVRTERKAVPVPLRLHRSGVHTTELQDSKLFEQASFILAVGAQLPDAQLRNDFPQAATIGPVNEFEDLIEGGLRGVPVTPLPLMPPQLPHHAGRIYFELDRQNAYWQRMPSSRGLAILVAGNFPGLEVECWAIRD